MHFSIYKYRLILQICFVSFSIGGLVAFYAERKLHTLVAKVGSKLPMAQYRDSAFDHDTLICLRYFKINAVTNIYNSKHSK